MQVTFTATLQKFAEKGEKTGWTFIAVPADLAALMHPGRKTSFRVKGVLDMVPIARLALMPMGDGTFILPINARLRQQLKKKEGSLIKARLERDDRGVEWPEEMKEAIRQSPHAQVFLETLPLSHRHYYMHWVSALKTPEKRLLRCIQALQGLEAKLDFGAFMDRVKALKK